MTQKNKFVLIVLSLLLLHMKNEEDTMNKTIGKIGAVIVTVTVVLFAVCMLLPFDFGSYFVCMLLALGNIMLAAGFCEECKEVLGLTIRSKTRADKWLKGLMMLHGVFFFGCFILPMTGVFRSMSGGGVNLGGVIALEFWCAYFLPIGALSFVHFRK